jgi:putative flippase GtrA
VSLTRQAPLFLLMGGIQLVLDSAVTIGLSRTGVALGVANVIGRVCGAMLGFWLNGRFTFGGPGSRLGLAALARFLIAWLLLTGVSTLALAAVESSLGLQAAWIAKPAVEAALAAVSFFVSRHWVYRTA